MQRLVGQIDSFNAKDYYDSGAQTFHYIGTKKHIQV